MADVITTQADTFRGGVDANQTAAFILNVGGPGPERVRDAADRVR